MPFLGIFGLDAEVLPGFEFIGIGDGVYFNRNRRHCREVDAMMTAILFMVLVT